MKIKTLIATVSVFCILPSAFTARAATTIDPAHPYAHGANTGWINTYADGAHGAVIGEYVCSGHLYSANLGWINLGGGAPANQIQYQNNSAGDFGVNQDGLGNLRGYAWGANIGWINFENTGAPKVDLVTGKFSGYAYSANCGWISLSNAAAYVQTGTIASGADSDGDGIADAWELAYTNTLAAFTAVSDADNDGMSDRNEYVAGTKPLDPKDNLRITSFQRGLFGDPNRIDLVWTSKPARWYRVQHRLGLEPGSPWAELTLGYEGLAGWNNAAFYEPAAPGFYRIRALRPLAP